MENLSFSEAAQKLARIGIKKECIYLIDLILLIEIAWSDGKIQTGEIKILLDYLKSHVNSINRMAGIQVLTYSSAKEFIKKYLMKRPDKKTLKIIHDIIQALKINQNHSKEATDQRINLLNACIDIASSSVTHYPYGLKERFTQEEKNCYHEIASILTGQTKNLIR